MKLALLALALAGPQIPIEVPTPPPVPEPAGPVVALETSEGVIRIGLFSERSPKSVANFLSYVRSGHYAGTIFHRVIPDFMVQGGGLGADLVEKPTDPPIRNEARNNLRNARGTVALARLDDPDSATAQFFINVQDNHRLDFGIAGAGYAVFGKVLEGMDVVDRIARVPTQSSGPHANVPIQPVTIVNARVEEPPARAGEPGDEP
jgi:peptidyl-prolyl cis-trans isomerase A (cyclophilin A)